MALLFLACRQRTFTQQDKVGQHTVVITETSGVFGSGGHDYSSGTDVFTYDSANLRVVIKNEVLFVNGRKYTIPNKTDSIEIVDGAVKINGRQVVPDTE